jgi:gliding motility-associated-like protein
LKLVTKYLILFSVLLFANTIKATHIVGGEIYYDYLGANKYKITLKVYRDCGPNTAPLETRALLCIFDANNNLIDSLRLRRKSDTQVTPSINNPCIQPPNNVCVEEGIFDTILTLPPKTGGYYIVYQRCCRNGSILNIPNPLGTGTTYYEHIPGPEIVASNSSPRFNKFPPIFLCNGVQIKFDHSATDPDGDVLVYSLCSTYDGCSPPPSNNVCPPTPPPYTNLQFLSPYSSSFPVSANPALNINSSTGFMTGTPDIDGQWVVGVCVQEFRGSQLIGVHYREFQFNVVTCAVSVLAQFNNQSDPVTIGTTQLPNQFCAGNTIKFINSSFGGNIYNWNFGDLTTLADTSHAISPSYTYPDTGSYVVTLVVNPGNPCSDTIHKTFYIYPPLNPTFVAPPPQCIKSNSFNFTVGGQYAPTYTSFNWNFGASALPVTSTLSSPTGIVYNAAGLFPVSVIIQQKMCQKTLKDTVEVYPVPTANFVADSVMLCDPATVTFTNNSTSGGTPTYLWQYSDGGSSTAFTPTHVFTPPGVYNVTLTVISGGGCIDTAKFVVPGMITVNPRPIAAFSLTPSQTTVFDPDISFFDQSSNGNSWYYDFGDGDASGIQNTIHTYNHSGDFAVVQIVSNQFNCPDTAVRYVHITPEFRFWVPNSFTPGNKDGKNDIFIPIVIGAEKYLFEIYDRWGQCIFRTKDTTTGWDGTMGGTLCKMDTYVWMITLFNEVTHREEVHYGNVNLIR